MSRFTLCPEVRNDLKEISRHIRQDNPRAAHRLRKIFFDKFRLLAKQPLIGKQRDDLAENLRMFPVRDYLILYEPTETGIAVVQVVHGARDLHSVLRRLPDR